MSKKIHYHHDEVIYVPCYQNNINPDYPTFTYSMSDATHDEQLCYSLNPDYVLVLKGEFDAWTK